MYVVLLVQYEWTVLTFVHVHILFFYQIFAEIGQGKMSKSSQFLFVCFMSGVAGREGTLD